MKKAILVLSIIFLAISLTLITTHQSSKTIQKKVDLSTSAGLNAYLFEQKKERKGKFKFDKPDEAMAEEVALRSLVDQPVAYKQGWRVAALAEAQTMRPNSLRKVSALDWVERGPGNFAGRTRAIVVDPRNEDIWLVGAVGGGVWKTTDAGTTWRSVTDDMPVLSVCAMDLCRNYPDVIYAGTGEGFYNYDAIVGDGMFKSIDGGETWTQLSSTTSNSNFRFVNRIIVDPDNPDIVLAATNSGLYRSINGGDSWSEVFNDGNRVQQIIANPLNFNTQFIAVNPSGIYKSTNAGQSWTYVSEEITNNNRIEMAIAEVDTNILYAAPVNSSSGLLGFFRSADAGNSWTDYGNSTNWLGGQGWYDNTLVVSPLNANIIFVGGIDLYRVIISGSTMNTDKLTHWYSGAGYPYVHADQHFLVTINITANNFSIIAANDGGIHASYDRGVNWTELNNNFNVTQYYDADKHPSSMDIIGGTQDNGTHRSPNNPIYSSSWQRVIGGDGFDCAWNKHDPNIVYGTLYSSRIYKSTDGGYNFTQINNGLPESNIFHTPLEMNKYHSDTLYTVSGSNQVYYTFNGGSNWTAVSANLNGYSRAKLAASLSNPDVVWAGATTIYCNISTDAGMTYSPITQPAGSPHAWLTGISTHPTDDAAAFLTIGASGYGKIYRTEDLGSSWEDITNNLPDVPVFTVLVMPFNTDEIWIGTDVGLFISENGGQSWQYSDEGLPAVSIRRLKIVGQEIVATTHGRGIWTVFREELNPAPLLAPTLADLTVPNPNTGLFKLRLQSNSNYDSVLVYVNGQVADRLYNIPAGIDTFGLHLTQPPEMITARADGYRGQEMRASDEKSRMVYAAVDVLIENFDDLETTFFGDLTAENTSDFNTALLNSEHPYSHNKNHIGYLGTPITIKPGATLTYRDVAIVEPGESGSVYGDENFWDYITVEASRDGDIWDILITPYDCRYDPVWEQAYNNGSSGNEAMLRSHSIDLTQNYMIDENIYVRFRLFADPAANGWGWAIDDVEVDNIISTLEDQGIVLHSFNLLGNYPNPFNPQTTIRFTLAENGPVTLAVYNNLGQKIRMLYQQEMLPGGSLHQAVWDGRNEFGEPVASGTYFYQLESGSYRMIRKMVLLR